MISLISYLIKSLKNLISIKITVENKEIDSGNIKIIKILSKINISTKFLK